MKAYSQDLRERIVGAIEQGMAREEIVKVFAVSLATIKRYLKQYRETGTLAAKMIPGRPSKKLVPLQLGVREQLEACPDATLEQQCDQWKEKSGTRVSPSTMSRAIRRLGWTRKKKTLGASERDEEERNRWREQMKQMDAAQLVIVDEMGSNIGLTPIYAWSPQGERALDHIPRNRGKNTTLLASLSLEGMGAAMILEGATDTLAFQAFVERVLAPSLHPGQIVVMDNLSSHLGAKIREAIEAKGCQLLFLPAYSPDLSPIEEAFSKLKAFLRRVKARTKGDLYEALSHALDLITSHDALGWFSHCGYRSA